MNTSNIGSGLQKLNSLTETELDEISNLIGAQLAQLKELRSRLGLVLSDKNNESGCDGVNPVSPVRNSPLVARLKTLKEALNSNSLEINSITYSLEI